MKFFYAFIMSSNLIAATVQPQTCLDFHLAAAELGQVEEEIALEHRASVKRKTRLSVLARSIRDLENLYASTPDITQRKKIGIQVEKARMTLASSSEDPQSISETLIDKRKQIRTRMIARLYACIQSLDSETKVIAEGIQTKRIEWRVQSASRVFTRANLHLLLRELEEMQARLSEVQRQKTLYEQRLSRLKKDGRIE